MGLRTKFNLVMVSVFLVGLAISAAVSWRLLRNAAREEVIQNAGIMMAAAQAIRGYTVKEVRPQINQDASTDFIPETVPAFAATEAFNSLRETYPDYSYKEATLNPTNLRDRATDWEADIVDQFQINPEVQELVGQRDSNGTGSLWLARPITIVDPACLDCHSTADKAPAALIKSYGSANGFGWQMGETVGSQIVMVPTRLTFQKAERAFLLFMASLTFVFIILFAVLNFGLSRMVIAPITSISSVADQVSMGNMSVPEFDEGGTDEISTLKASFNRMRRSLERAMEMIRD